MGIGGGGGGVSGDQFINTFVGGAAGPDTRFVYDQTTGALSFDADGTGTNAAPVQIAQMAPGTVLTAADIQLIHID